MQSTLSQRFAEVQRRIAEAAARAHRDPAEITVIGVTKTLSAAQVAEGVEAGLTSFGENRLQGVPEKLEALRRLLGDERASRLTWHFIGHLQSNKVHPVLEMFSFIHSLDREKLIDRVDRIAGEMGIVAHCLIQVNVSGADTQGGVDPEALGQLAEYAANRGSLRVHGLMAIGPNTDDAGEIRRAFRHVRELAREMEALHLPGVGMEMLSLGMSADYEIAVEEGATHVRIGTAIFGLRRT